VAVERVKLEVQERAQRGSAANRRLRREGLVPGVLYGGDLKSRAITVPEPELRRALTGAHGAHAILDVVVDGEKKAHPSILKDYQRDPARGGLLHFDLQVVRLDQPIHASVAVTLIGDAVGARAGGIVAPAARELSVEALPAQVPDQIEVDISELEIGDSLHLFDLTAPEGVTFLDDPETLVVNVTPPTRVVEEEEEVEGEEAEVEGEEAEGEAAAGESSAGEGETPSE
jgi:large subunit ribosomal protein L25